MARRVFYSFHYQPDAWRVSQVRNIGALEDNKPCSDNDWEEIRRGGDSAIERWIAGQMEGRSCVVVLIGAKTAGRKWINYEIKNAWDAGKGLVGVYIHNLKNAAGEQSVKGTNPFAGFSVDGERLSSIVRAYDPPLISSRDVYEYIASNLEGWVEEAIGIRQRLNG